MVVGSGYLGAALAARRPDALHTSRRPDLRSHERRWIVFDTAAPSTWDALRTARAAAAVATLPLRPESASGPVAELLLAVAPRLLVVGSTSAFGDVAEVDDDTPLDPADERAAAEERLRRGGATVLHAAGIYGPGRNPLDWVRRGLIRDPDRLVNLVHVDDLARACLFLVDHFVPGRRCVVSDGTPRGWSEVLAWAALKGYVSAAPGKAAPATGKRVVPRTLPALGFTLAHPDLYAELDRLERGAG